MTRIHEGLEDRDFDMPASVDKISVCEETGLLPRAGCPVITEYFDIGDIPTDYCDQHFYGDDESGMQEYTTEEEIYNPESLYNRLVQYNYHCWQSPHMPHKALRSLHHVSDHRVQVEGSHLSRPFHWHLCPLLFHEPVL